MSLNGKYILCITCILLLSIGVFSWRSLELQENRIREDDRERVALLTEIIKNGLVTIMLEGRGKEFQKFLETLIAKDIEKIRILRPDGIIVSSSIPTEIGNKISPKDISIFKTQKAPVVFSREREGNMVYSMMVPIYNERPCQRCHGERDEIRGILDVEISMKKTLQRIEDSRKSMLFLFIIIFVVLSVSLGILITYLVNKPIAKIIDTMKKAEGGDLKVRFLTERKDEIGKLASSLNSMLSDLEGARREIEKCHNEEIQRVEQMATMGELVSAIVHEIKNPLARISGAMQVFAEDFPLEDPRREIINEILSKIEQLDKTVSDLLNFSRPPDPHPMPTQIKPLIERAQELIAPQAEKQRVSIKLAYKDDIEEINIDQEQMYQVFLNIMLNAIQSMPGGGMLTIATYFRTEENEVEIAFSDTGYGIAQDDLKNIFKPFFTAKDAGTGLGLAISRDIVEKHDGRIVVDSQVGVGSTFRVILPGKR